MKYSIFVFIIGHAVMVQLAYSEGHDEVEDFEALKGTWKIVKARYDGKDDNESIGAKITFAKGKVSIELGNRSVKGKVSLDFSRTPKWLDVITRRDDITTTFRAITSIKGDMLVICHGQPDAPRPSEFTTKPGDKRSLVFAKKVTLSKGAIPFCGQQIAGNTATSVGR